MQRDQDDSNAQGSFPESGELTSCFQGLSAPKHKKEQEKIAHQNKEVRAITDVDSQEQNEVLAGGIRSRFGFLDIKEKNRSKKKKEKAFIEFLLQRLIQDSLQRIKALLKFYKEQMQFLSNQIEEKTQFLDQIKKLQEDINKAIESFQEKGIFELDEDRLLANEVIELAIQRYEREEGISVDKNSPELYLILLEILGDIEVQKDKLSFEIQNHEADYKQYQSDYETFSRIEQSLLSDDPSVQIQGLEQLGALYPDTQVAIGLNILNSMSDTMSQDNIMEAVGLVDEDLEALNFSFDFPPLQQEFQKSTHKPEEKQKITNEQSTSFSKLTAPGL